MKRRPIPRFEPEVICAAARKNWHGDNEKVPTTSIRHLVVDGVELSSRYDKADEYELMREMVLGVEAKARKYIDTIFCDSKAGSCFGVRLKPCSKKQAWEIASSIEQVCLAGNGGYNSIHVEGSSGGSFYFEPNWVGDPD